MLVTDTFGLACWGCTRSVVMCVKVRKTGPWHAISFHAAEAGPVFGNMVVAGYKSLLWVSMHAFHSCLSYGRT